MEKRTNLFGWDITPRRDLWQEIRRLHKQLEEAEEALRRTNGDTIRLTRENAELRRTSCKRRTNTKKQRS